MSAGSRTAAGPLDGITVVALEQAVAAPFATRQLADLGARVIKVERPRTGDFARAYDRTVRGQSSYFVWLNRGKESIELDIKQPGDREVLDAMIAEADILVQNLLPGAVERLGLDAATLCDRDDRLIHCSISGYGADGPYRLKKAYDLLVQCEAGMLAVTGTRQTPSKVGVSVADVATGMYAYTGVLTALYDRLRTGRGQALQVAMLDALGEWMSQPAYFSMYGDERPRRTGARHASIAPYGPYRVGGDGSLFIAVQNDREWALLCERVLDRPDLVADPRFVTNPQRVANDEQITGLIEGALASREIGEVIAMLDHIGIAQAQLREPGDLIDHPQMSARDRWREVHTAAGPMRAMVPPVMLQGYEAQMGAVPGLGEHNQTLRAEFVTHEVET